MFLNKIKVGFSLIEVNIAILIAAGGMLSLFALFPIGLRQSVMSEADLHQAAFASSFFEAISANVKVIDDVQRWNNITLFWKDAVYGTGISDVLVRPAAIRGDTNLAESTRELIESSLNPEAEELRFVCRETDDDSDFSGTELKLPPQMLIRIRPSITNGGLPKRYVVSLFS